MNEKAVKQLTKKGCIVQKDVAAEITPEDVETIEQLDSIPMYITRKMISKIRDEVNVSGNSEQKLVMKEETTQEELEEEQPEKTEAQEEKVESIVEEREGTELKEQSDETEKKQNTSSPSGTVIRDTGSRKVDTKVEVLDPVDISKQEKDVPEFLGYYNDRYDRMKKILTKRMELKSAVSIQRLDRRDEGDEAVTIGLVKNKYSTKSGRYIIELEDKTGTFSVLVDERDGDRIVPDEVLGVRGNMGDGIIFANSVIRPDLPIPDGVNTTNQKVRAAYISDLHIGSEETLYNRMDKFAKWLHTDAARDIGYLVIPGDLVEGVGTYPGQEEELDITDIYKQYERFERWAEKLPTDIEIVIGPGNHDIVRLAEPQPKLSEKALPEVSQWDNVHLVQNPQYVRLHGIESQGILNLMYHGYSFDTHVDKIQDLREKAYDDPHHVMIDLLKRRHLAPTYGSNLMSPEGRDCMVMERIPDIFVSGHFHSHSNESYKGVNVICASTFQAQTDFQKRMGHEPQPGLVTVVDYKTRNTEVKKF